MVDETTPGRFLFESRRASGLDNILKTSAQLFLPSAVKTVDDGPA